MPGPYLSAITSLPPASFASFPNANKKAQPWRWARLRGNLQIVHKKNIVFSSYPVVYRHRVTEPATVILEHDSSSHKPIPQAPIRSRNRMGAIFFVFQIRGAGGEAGQRGKRYMGGNGKVEGRACPAPTGCQNGLRTRGAREGGSPPLCSGRGLPGMDGDVRPVGTLQASQAPLKGAFLRSPDYRSLFPAGFGELPTQKWRKGRGVKNEK